MSHRGPDWYQFSIGKWRAWILTDGPITDIPPTDEFPRVPQAQMQDLLARYYLSTQFLNFEQNCLLIETETELVLFDTGMGTCEALSRHAGRLESSLESAGIDRDKVTSVMLTHAHVDHLFGLTGTAGRARFPNAKVFISRQDFDFWTSQECARQSEFNKLNVSGAIERFETYKTRVHFIADGDEPIKGIKALASPGHTVGHLCFAVGRGKDRCLVMGDTAYHYAISFEHPEWHSSFDTDPVMGASTRSRILGLAADGGLRVLGYHFPFPGIGHIDRIGTNSFRYVPEPMDLR